MLLKSIIFLFLLFILWITFRFIFTSINRLETPIYSVVLADQDFELRHYDEFFVAQTIQSGERQQAISQSFGRLFSYISGNNLTHEKISMTAPVLQQPYGKEWKVAFIMPRLYDYSELPTPKDSSIVLVRWSEAEYICLKFSGGISDNNLHQHLLKFQSYVQANHYQIDGEPIFAFYNPPWTLPFLRRNEIWSKVIKIDRAVVNPHHELVEDKDHQKKHH